jgi:hypothetical protein
MSIKLKLLFIRLDRYEEALMKNEVVKSQAIQSSDVAGAPIIDLVFSSWAKSGLSKMTGVIFPFLSLPTPLLFLLAPLFPPLLFSSLNNIRRPLFSPYLPLLKRKPEYTQNF